MCSSVYPLSAALRLPAHCLTGHDTCPRGGSGWRPVSRFLALFKGFDDDHAPATTRAGFVIINIPACLLFAGLLWLLKASEQFADFGDVAYAVAIGKEAGVTNAMKALGQNMDEETTHKLMSFECHDFLPLCAFLTIIFPLEGDIVAIG